MRGYGAATQTMTLNLITPPTLPTRRESGLGFCGEVWLEFDYNFMRYKRRVGILLTLIYGC